MSLEIIKPGSNYNFIGNRYKAFVISGLLILASIVSVIYHKGLNLGVDFKGGLLLQFSLTDDPGAEALREIFAEGGFTISSLQNFGEDGKEYLVNVSEGPTGDGEKLSESALALLNERFGEGKINIDREEMVGPKVGADLRQKALYAIYYSILIIIIYISGRFEQKWGTSAIFVAILLGVIYLVGLFGVGVGILILVALVVTLITCYMLKFSFALGGIIALIHDVVITTGIFSLLNKEITLSFVAAILTIIGYSLNDSIIVFDRIRENTQKNRKGDLATLINKSINETLSRTILTSGTTILALLSLYFLGGPVNRDFALALLIGVVVGTLSSIFLASPILLLWEKKTPELPAKAKAAGDLALKSGKAKLAKGDA
ncbi:MAG: protein translocase subunit SecF [Deltaproteobacteria bacterium]|jgi:preprotein translocase subunit SecF|nr:protein translocase subunit SecF [Deltaproteobacteria bacterium]